MTTVWFWKSARGRIIAYAALGHAGYADPGEDIVCAGISALTQTTVNALEAIAGIQAQVKVQPGWLWVRLPKEDSHDAQVILRTMAQGLQDMAQAYPEHLRLIWKEMRCKA